MKREVWVVESKYCGKWMPLAVDLFCGLGGWSQGLLAERWDVVGFDIEQHVYGEERYPAQLVLQDVLTIHGKQFRNVDLIVASPPCQEYSYMAMPWSKAKAIAAEYRSGTRDVKKLTALFDACFRIQREACEASGRFIPMVVENVRGAIPWVGRSRWNFGSFHLWGDVPALMPITTRAVKVGGIDFNGYGTPGYKAVAFNGTAEKRLREGQKPPGFRFDGSGKSFQTESVRRISKAWRDKRYDETKKSGYHVSDDGVKGFTPHGQPLGKNELATHGSKSKARKARKAAIAAIAKIPLPLARHIARVFKPTDATPSTPEPTKEEK